MIKLQQTTDSVKGGPDGCIFFFISDSGLIPKVKILTAIKKKKQESNRNKYYKSLWIKYTCRIITNKRSMPKTNKNKQNNFLNCS